MHLAALVLAFATAIAASFGVAQFAIGAGEPSLNISLSDDDLRAGETALVFFEFSATPLLFDDADVDISGASGTLSPVLPTANDRIFRAAFTPAAATVDATNVISVGTSWTDTTGIAPLSETYSPNFLIDTTPVPPSGGGSNPCKPPSVSLASPEPDQSFVAGSEMELFWTMSGCQASAMAILLSLDGEPYVEVARSFAPATGYYRFTLPAGWSDVMRVGLRMLGQGDVTLASADVGPLTLTQAVVESPPEEATPDNPPDDGSAAKEVSRSELKDRFQDGDIPTQQDFAAPAPGTSGTDAPPDDDAAAKVPRPVLKEYFQTGDRPTQPQGRIVIQVVPATRPEAGPQLAHVTKPAQDPIEPINVSDTSMKLAQAQQNPGNDASAQAVSLEGVTGAVETAAEFAPSGLDPIVSFVLGGFAMLGLVLGMQKLQRDQRTKQGRNCKHCAGSGEEPKAGAETCDECGGSGRVEEESEEAVECPLCGGEGEDPCHTCKGSGKMPDGTDCDDCEGGGITLEDGERMPCEKCDGEGEIGGSVKRMVSCEKCGGTGKA